MEEAYEAYLAVASQFALAEVGGAAITPWVARVFSRFFSTQSKGVALIEKYLGPGSRAVKNEAGDLILVSKDGAKRVRFDINRPYPHESPHAHVEELVNGKWQKSGQIYPTDVPHK